MFTKFCQDAAGALRMQEGDVETLGTLAGLLVDEAHTFVADLSQGIGHPILNAEGYMVHTLVTLVEPFLNGALGRCGLQQFSPHFRKAVFTFWSSTTSVA